MNFNPNLLTSKRYCCLYFVSSFVYPCTDAETNLMTCVGVPLKVSSNEVIPEYSEKHNFTIHGFFQNLYQFPIYLIDFFD